MKQGKGWWIGWIATLRSTKKTCAHIKIEKVNDHWEKNKKYFIKWKKRKQHRIRCKKFLIILSKIKWYRGIVLCFKLRLSSIYLLLSTSPYIKFLGLNIIPKILPNWHYPPQWKISKHASIFLLKFRGNLYQYIFPSNKNIFITLWLTISVSSLYVA